MLNIKGGKPLNIKNTEIILPGFKHATVAALCNTVSFPDTTFHFANVPLIADTYILKEILVYLGADCHLRERTLSVCTKNLINKPLPANLCAKVHGTLYLFPVLLSRFGEANISATGGCMIGDKDGSRPVDHMIKVMEKFGYSVHADKYGLHGKRTRECPDQIVIDIQDFSTLKTELTGPYISGATKTALLLAGAMHDQQSLMIKNPYTKPDVTELLSILGQLRYQVTYQDSILYMKVHKSMVDHVYHELLGDLSVLMTYITIAVLYEHHLAIQVPRIEDLYHCLKAEFDLLQEMGVMICIEDNVLKISSPSQLNPVEINVYSTSLYSDHQPFFALMLTKASGVSAIREFVWTNRFGYARELAKLGYHLEILDNTLKIYPGAKKNHNIHLKADDLRAAAVLILAAIYSKGDFTIQGHQHLQRGYEDLIPSLTKMGASIGYV